MSLATKRQEIADTISSIPGLRGLKYRPSAPNTGDGWAQLASMPRVDGWFVTSWNILIHLPQDEASASKWLDENLEAILEGLESPSEPYLSVGYIDSAEPANIAVGNAFQYGLLISLRSE